MAETLTARVKRGAKLLDENKRGWFLKINEPSLNLADGKQCVLGQLFGDYAGTAACNWLGESSDQPWSDCVNNRRHLGFTAKFGEQWNRLTSLWLKEITARKVKQQ